MRPSVYPCDERGRIVTGFLHGEAALTVALRHFPPHACGSSSYAGNTDGTRATRSFPSATLPGRPLVSVAQVDKQGTEIASLAGRDQIGPGAYQFIARAFRPGWWLADDDRLLADDVASDRRFALLVIRVTAKLAGWYENGVVLTPEIAGLAVFIGRIFTSSTTFRRAPMYMRRSIRMPCRKVW